MQDEPTSYRIEDPGVRELFSEISRYQAWLDVEAALAQSQAELGVIPQYAADEITRKAKIALLDMPAVRYTALETPHIVVESLKRDTLEDTIDNMLALDVFEGCFTLVNDDENTRTTGDGKRATTEVAAVVINEVLTVHVD